MRIAYGLTALALACCTAAQAATPVQLSLPGVNLPAAERVEGVRLDLLYGQTQQVTGLDLPLFALSDTNDFSGLQLGLGLGAGRVRNSFKGVAVTLFNWHEGRDVGGNLGLVNYNQHLQGVNLAGVANVTGDVYGINAASFVNVTGDVRGLNLAAVNVSRGNALASVAFINYAERATFQLGFFNATQHLDGIQIGLGNYAPNGILPVMPLVNFNKSL